MRNWMVALAALVLVPAGLWAEEIRGQIKSVNASSNNIVLTIGDKEQSIDCSTDCRVTMMVSNRAGLFGRRTVMQESITTMSSLSQGMQVTVITQQQQGSEMATQIRIGGSQAITSTQPQSSSYVRTRRFR